MLPRCAAWAVALCWISVPAALAGDSISGVTAKATSEQVPKLFAAQNLCTDKGLSDVPGMPGAFRFTTNGYAEGGNCWHSGYIALGADERPLIEFDLGKVHTVDRIRVWNYNGMPHHGFREVSVDFSADGRRWQSHPARLTFKKAPKSDDYLGEEYAFEPAITARHVRFFCESTHRVGGQRDLAGLGKVRFYAVEKSTPPAPVKALERFPVGITKVLNRGDALLRPAFLQGSEIPLYVGGVEK